jgi:Tfp pilus assembly protein PilV
MKNGKRLTDVQLIIKMGELGLDETQGKAVLFMLSESWQHGYAKGTADAAKRSAMHGQARANLQETVSLLSKVRHGR